MISLKSALRNVFLKLGIDIRLHDSNYVRVKYKDTSLARRTLLLQNHNINLILDVGANVGQYACSLRRVGYKGRIVSFEPLSSAFTHLKSESEQDALWQVVNIALGDQDGQDTIRIASNLVSSSLLRMRADKQFGIEFIGQEEIVTQRLDSVFPQHYASGEQVFLKIDAQGYEMKILQGAQNSLTHIAGVQLEMSVAPLYEGENTLLEMLVYMQSSGYNLMSLEPGFSDQTTGQLLQVDGIFFRTPPITPL